MKAQRTVGAKCVLAARIDLERVSRDGSFLRPSPSLDLGRLFLWRQKADIISV
jgi:hypothetical protein